MVSNNSNLITLYQFTKDSTVTFHTRLYQIILNWFSAGTPVSSTNETDSHDIAEILLKVALNTINKQQIHSFN
jgi:hypothetical protein